MENENELQPISTSRCKRSFNKLQQIKNPSARRPRGFY